jgi:hypothetical protein
MSNTHTRSLHCYLVYIMVRFQRGSIASSRDGLADRAAVTMGLAQMSTNVKTRPCPRSVDEIAAWPSQAKILRNLGT